MAAHSLDRERMNAIARVCYEATNIIKEVQETFHPTGDAS